MLACSSWSPSIGLSDNQDDGAARRRRRGRPGGGVFLRSFSFLAFFFHTEKNSGDLSNAMSPSSEAQPQVQRVRCELSQDEAGRPPDLRLSGKSEQRPSLQVVPRVGTHLISCCPRARQPPLSRGGPIPLELSRTTRFDKGWAVDVLQP